MLDGCLGPQVTINLAVIRWLHFSFHSQGCHLCFHPYALNAFISAIFPVAKCTTGFPSVVLFGRQHSYTCIHSHIILVAKPTKNTRAHNRHQEREVCEHVCVFLCGYVNVHPFSRSAKYDETACFLWRYSIRWKPKLRWTALFPIQNVLSSVCMHSQIFKDTHKLAHSVLHNVPFDVRSLKAHTRSTLLDMHDPCVQRVSVVHFNWLPFSGTERYSVVVLWILCTNIYIRNGGGGECMRECNFSWVVTIWIMLFWA